MQVKDAALIATYRRKPLLSLEKGIKEKTPVSATPDEAEAKKASQMEGDAFKNLVAELGSKLPEDNEDSKGTRLFHDICHQA